MHSQMDDGYVFKIGVGLSMTAQEKKHRPAALFPLPITSTAGQEILGGNIT